MYVDIIVQPKDVRSLRQKKKIVFLDIAKFMIVQSLAVFLYQNEAASLFLVRQPLVLFFMRG